MKDAMIHRGPQMYTSEFSHRVDVMPKMDRDDIMQWLQDETAETIAYFHQCDAERHRRRSPAIEAIIQENPFKPDSQERRDASLRAKFAAQVEMYERWLGTRLAQGMTDEQATTLAHSLMDPS